MSTERTRTRLPSGLIPGVGIALFLAYYLFARIVGAGPEAKPDYGVTPFVPAESPYSTGRDSR